MRFLIDQDVYAVTTRFLRNLGHDVVTAAELGLSRAIDADLLRHARADHRIFVTRDRDFGRLVFAQNMGAGIIFLRMTPANANGVHQELQRVLGRYREDELLQVFLVIESVRHRLRRTSK
jgi:predicted nuclease of predicted toxin-antitoxin system